MDQIEISGITKRYLGDGTETLAVRDVSLSLCFLKRPSKCKK